MSNFDPADDPPNETALLAGSTASCERLLAALRAEEGFSAHCYMCAAHPAGRQTIGYGRNIDANGGIGITEAEAEMLLRNDVSRVFAECRGRWSWFGDLDSSRQEVVAHLAYQLGQPRIGGFVKMLAALAARDYQLAAVELLDSRYATQVPNRAGRLAEQLAGGTSGDAQTS
jgi:lysozyme